MEDKPSFVYCFNTGFIDCSIYVWGPLKMAMQRQKFGVSETKKLSREEKLVIDQDHCWEDGYDAVKFWEKEVIDLCRQAMILVGNRQEQVMPFLTFMNMYVFARMGVQNLIKNFRIEGNIDNFSFYEDSTKLILAMSELIVKMFERDYESIIISDMGAEAWNDVWRTTKPLREDIHFGELIEYMQTSPTKAAEIACISVNKLCLDGVPVISPLYY